MVIFIVDIVVLNNAKYWQVRNRNVHDAIQLNEMSDVFLEDGMYTVVYIRIIDIEINKLGNKLLNNLGTHLHAQCHEYHLPLISSTECSNIHVCGKKKYYECCDVVFIRAAIKCI